MIKRQVVTNRTDAVIAVVVTDGKGYMSAPHTESPLVLSFAKNVIVRLGVGREVFDSHYDGSGQSVVKDAWIELGVVPLRYVEERIDPTTESSGTVAGEGARGYSLGADDSSSDSSSSSSSSESESSSSSSSEGSVTLYRLPRASDDVDVMSLPIGQFLCFKVHVPRGTFGVTGAMKVAICNITSDSHFEDSVRRVWSKFGETNIVVSEI